MALSLEVRAPRTPGDYVLRVALVQELIAWFDDVNADSAALHSVRVEAASNADQVPLPPPHLAERVAGTPNLTWFNDSGRYSVEDIERVLRAVGASLSGHERILDFGCGCGRIIRWLSDDAEDTDIYGADIDGAAIDWATEHLPYATFVRNEHLPPLPFDDEYFDLIYSQSVFTHLPEDFQDAWLPELARVLRKGQLAVLSVNGEFVYEDQFALRAEQNPSLRDAWAEHGFVYVDDDSWTGGPFPDFYHSTVHAPWYLFQHWGEFFELVAHLAKASLNRQDFVVVRKR